MSFSAADFEHAPLEELIAEASRVRRERFGDAVECCSIVNVKSGRCSMDCRFCAQSGHYDAGAPVYPLRDGTTVETASRAYWERGVHRVGWVAGGGALGRDEVERIAEISAALDASCRRCVSFGRLDADSLRRLKDAGVSRYHHNLETSERFYPNICTTQSWRDRFETLRRAREIGFEICGGGLFGLGESWTDRIELAETLRQLEVDSVPINFFSPIPGTPLGARPLLPVDEALRIVALYRLLLPKTSIRICGGRPQTLGDRQPELFAAGADALMTGDYLTTSGCAFRDDIDMIENAGFFPANASRPTKIDTLRG